MKKVFNKIYGIAFLLSFLGIISSCDVTDLTPATLIPDEEAFGTAARIDAAVLGVYEAAQRGIFNGGIAGGGGRGYPFGAANVQQGDMRGEDMANIQLFYEITYTNTATPFSANNNNYWISIYRVINRANIVLENIDVALEEGIITQDRRDVIRGEMLFLRAFSHHQLLLFFARPISSDPQSPGVFYRTTAINDVPLVEPAEELGRTTVAEDYELLLADLNEAEQLLPLERNTARARAGAAIALKSTVLLQMERWADVITEYNKLTGTFEVTSSVTAPFRGGGQSSDNIFSFKNSDVSNAGVNGGLGSMYGDPARGARGLVQVSPVIWVEDFWLEGDARRTELTTGWQPGSDSVGIYTFKYPDVSTLSDPNPVIRFAEVVLNAAEAHARQGNLGEAVTLLNIVRDRAIPAGAASHTVASLGDQNGVVEAIIQERRIEFLAEGKRWFDIHRLSGMGEMPGIPGKSATRATNFAMYTGEEPINFDHDLEFGSFAFIWPLPQQEILNRAVPDPSLQNPGY
ncbi:MAG: RagB/SusD family nutrient uptake outer membrane protein [Cyclobacteriaceae bacterium]|nr:RagB/SusD family nutrient uptake outer membrane protein [Cyclobacteriaceae bacterium]MCH8515790.1 RagB/SusD family nutrient uptake outer membrane protein [Cyclobacteriaceae bacterium]